MFGSKNQGGASETPMPANTPTAANRTVLLAGLAGIGRARPPQLSTNFATSGGASSGAGRKPGISKRVLIGGA